MGGQAKVVTFTLDALYAMDDAIETALILHFSPQKPRIKRALAQLSAKFIGNAYQGQTLDYRRVPVQVDDQTLPHVRTAEEAEAVWRLARDLLTDLKQAGCRLPLCIAGGPRILALTLTSAAMLHCDHRDRLWHLYTRVVKIWSFGRFAIIEFMPLLFQFNDYGTREICGFELIFR